MADHEDDIALTPDHPGFGAAVVTATRALIEQVAAWASEGQASTRAAALTDAPVLTTPPSVLPPVLPK